jgi:hypothetical protein
VVSHQELYVIKDNTATPGVDERTVPVKNPFDPSCTHVPGIVREGKVWVDTYVSDSLGRYNGLKWFFNAKYREGVAVAKESYRYQYGRQASCAFLNTFDGKNEVQALRAMTCQNFYANQSVRPNRWCQLANRIDQGLQVPNTVNLKTEQCREPRWNGGKWGPMGWAAWHNQHVKLDTTDILKEVGLDWVPGHFNIDTYAEDFDMLSGVQNVNPDTLQPWDNPTGGEKRWIGYGKAQTAPSSELWVRFFDAVARAKGVNPILYPIKAHETTAPNAIANNALLTINLYPDIPAQSKWITVRVGDYRRDLFQLICAFSPWLADTLGDGPTGQGPPPLLVVPMPAPQSPCQIGFRLWRPVSSQANGWSFLSFTRIFSPDDAKELKGHETQLAQILQEAFFNHDRVNRLIIRSPFDTDANGNVILNCHIEQDLGVSRGELPDGTVDVNAKDPHFRRFFRS